MRLNLVTNPSFKINTTGWSPQGSGVSIARITSDGFFGTTCLEVTKTAVINAGVTTTSRISVDPTSPYSVSAYVAIDTVQESSSLRLDIAWYTATSGGSLISTTSTALGDIGAGLGWTRLAISTTSPALARGATITIYQPAAGTSGKKFKLDAVLLEANSTVGDFFDDVSQGSKTKTVNTALTELPPPTFTGMKLNADIQLGKMILNSIDEYGVAWVCTDIKGWWTLPNPVVPNIERGWGDGSYDVKGRYAARDLTLEGVILPPSPSYIYQSRESLTNAINLVRGGAWLLTTEATGTVKASFVRLSGVPNIETVKARGKTVFSVGLRAADPIKYGWNFERTDGNFELDVACKSTSPAVGGSGTVVNSGNYEVPIYIQITGPLVGPSYITNTSNTTDSTSGQIITIKEALRPLTTKTINYAGLLDNVATIGTLTTHGLVAGDVITISGLGAPFDGEQLVLSVIGTPSASTQFTFEAVGANVTYAYHAGTLVYGPDVLEIDTYNRLTYLNGQSSGARSKLATYNDWITLVPGNNTITFSDAGTPSGSTGTIKVLYKSGWLS